MKRSNSTPMIHELLQDLSTDGGGSLGRKKKGEVGRGRDLLSNGGGLRHTRNLSTSNASLPGDLASMTTRSWLSPHRGYASLSSPTPISRLSSPPSRQHRVEQLKKEEMVDERLREEEQDREFTEQLHLNQSWGDMKLDDDAELKGMGEIAMEIAPSSSSSAPQYYSPSSPSMFPRLHQPDGGCFRKVRSRSLTPTSPVSTRSFNYYRRSCSPSPILRPSTLCIETNSRKRRRPNDPEEMDVSPTQVIPIHPPAKRAMVFASPLTLSPCVSPLSNNSPLHQSVSSNESRSAFSPASSSMPIFDSSANSRGLSCSSPGGFQSSSTSFSYPTIVMNNTAVSMPPSSSKMFHMTLESSNSAHLQSPHLSISSSPRSRHDHTSHVVLALSSLTPPHSHKHSSHPPSLHSYQNNHSASAFLPYKDSSSHSVVVPSNSNHLCDSTVNSSNEEQFISSVPS